MGARGTQLWVITSRTSLRLKVTTLFTVQQLNALPVFSTQTPKKSNNKWNESSYSAIIQKLRVQNKKLTEKLKEVSQALDNALEKSAKQLNKKQQIPPSIEQILKVKEKELANQEH